MVNDARGGHHPQLTAWAFVAIQFVLLALIVLLPRGTFYQATSPITVLGYVLMLAGGFLGIWSAVNLGRGLTPSPLPNGAVELVRTGTYRLVRHPMYSAVMLLSVGIAIKAGSLLVWAAVIALGVLFSIKTRWEESHLLAAFPGYTDYILSTPRFIPEVSSRRHT